MAVLFPVSTVNAFILQIPISPYLGSTAVPGAGGTREQTQAGSGPGGRWYGHSKLFHIKIFKGYKEAGGAPDEIPISLYVTFFFFCLLSF